MSGREKDKLVKTNNAACKLLVVNPSLHEACQFVMPNGSIYMPESKRKKLKRKSQSKDK